MKGRVYSGLVVTGLAACTGSSGGDEITTFGSATLSGSATAGPTSGSTSDGSASATEGGATTNVATSTDGGDTESGPGCTFCVGPNETCVDDVCVTTCQGQDPDPCAPAQECDVITGECRDPGTACTLSGSYTSCGSQSCGPGSVCDDAGVCIPFSPCASVVCTDEGLCWGDQCSCERAIECEPASDADLNGAFGVELSDLEFADDCTAWMVTLRSGPDFLRSLAPDGTLTQYTGVANLNMGEVAILRALTPPPALGRGPRLTTKAPPPRPVEGIGEVALTYVCCASCGCQANPPQGVARLDEGAAQELPLLIVAVSTEGTGPFGTAGADSGPFGLTWGADRVLYVGNSSGDGSLQTADLEAATQSEIHMFSARVTASAPVTEAHIAVATIGGSLHRYNVVTGDDVVVAELGEDVSSLAFDAFSGLLYASLRSLEVVSVHPFTGDVQPFQTMPGRGRVAVSPNGKLYFGPLQLIDAGSISSWDLPNSF